MRDIELINKILEAREVEKASHAAKKSRDRIEAAKIAEKLYAELRPTILRELSKSNRCYFDYKKLYEQNNSFVEGYFKKLLNEKGFIFSIQYPSYAYAFGYSVCYIKLKEI